MIISLTWVSSASAVNLGEKLELHGYGHAAYLETNKNTFLGADPGGTWHYKDASLVLTAVLHERSNAWVQLHRVDNDSRIDWAFVDYRFNYGSTLKLGRIKTPFGLYNDYRDVEYLRPSSVKPFMYLDVTSVIPESFQGVGYSYQSNIANGRMTLNMYSGKIIDSEDSDEEFKTLIGGRATYNAPTPGLEFIASFYQSGLKKNTGASDDIQTVAFSIGYKPESLDLKFEVARKSVFSITNFTYYGQVAYTINDLWRPFLRYDYITTDKNKTSDPSFYQRSIAVGLGYSINEYFGIRMEQHFNNGYGLAVATNEMTADAGEKNWSMTVISLNFIF